jgi:hypothetical protein
MTGAVAAAGCRDIGSGKPHFLFGAPVRVAACRVDLACFFGNAMRLARHGGMLDARHRRRDPVEHQDRRQKQPGQGGRKGHRAYHSAPSGQMEVPFAGDIFPGNRLHSRLANACVVGLS